MVRVWATVRFYDPAMLTNGVDWGAAFVAALPKVEAATDGASEAAAIDAMLSALRDPATRIVGPRRAASPGGQGAESNAPAAGGRAEPAETAARITRAAGEVLVVSVGVNDAAGLQTLQAEVERELPKAKAIVVDLRRTPYDWGTWSGSELLRGLAPKLITRELVVPSSRALERLGYEPDDGSRSAAAFRPSYQTALPTLVAPQGQALAAPRLAVIVGRGSEAPTLATVLQREAGAVVVAEGKITAAVPPCNSPLPLADGYAALVRDEEAPSLEPMRPDVEIARAEGGKTDPALEAALRLLKRPAARKPPASAATGEAPPRPRPAADDASPYPDRAHRILALARAWSALDQFWPYKRLLEPDAWGRAFVELLPAFEAARDEREYVLALAALGARTGDSHVDLEGGPSERHLDRRAMPPIDVLRVEGRPVVVRASDAAKAAGIAAGDVLEAVDDEPFGARVARLEPYVAASTPWDHAYRADLLAQGGPPGSTARLALRDASGRLKEVRLARARRLSVWPDAAPKYRVLDGNVGYANLIRLERGEVDAMLDALWATRALFLDMRGIPRFMMGDLAARLNQKRARVGGYYLRTPGGGVSSPPPRGDSVDELVIPATERPIYAGPVVVLVDERTFSVAEVDTQLLRAAGALVVGSPTAGVDGDMTKVCVPGGMCLTFSGADVRQADGTQQQRVGLRPDVEARPTLRGLREGRDEVLERALRLARERR